MNESGGVSAGIEAYIRQALKMKHNPMLIVKVVFHYCDTLSNIIISSQHNVLDVLNKGYAHGPRAKGCRCALRKNRLLKRCSYHYL